jgi:sugar O-acyltransferase (sialic acid O-acetyltransferase NeuD family)
MTSLAILGASGHGRVVADCAELCGWQKIVFFDDDWPVIHANDDWPVLGNTDSLLAVLADYDGVLVAIGNNRSRCEKIRLLRKAGATLISLVHPSATVSRYASIGDGVVVLAGAVVNVNSCIGDGAIINTAASVDHDCSLAAGVHVSPGANLAGGVIVGECGWIGIGSSVRQYITLGCDVIVGAGAVVIQGVSNGLVVVGVPAKVKV